MQRLNLLGAITPAANCKGQICTLGSLKGEEMALGLGGFLSLIHSDNSWFTFSSATNGLPKMQVNRISVAKYPCLVTGVPALLNLPFPIHSITSQSITVFKLSIWDLSLNHFIRVGILRKNVILCQLRAGRGHCCHLESIRGGAEVANVRREQFIAILFRSSLDPTTSATPSDHLTAW